MHKVRDTLLAQNHEKRNTNSRSEQTEYYIKEGNCLFEIKGFVLFPGIDLYDLTIHWDYVWAPRRRMLWTEWRKRWHATQRYHISQTACELLGQETCQKLREELEISCGKELSDEKKMPRFLLITNRPKMWYSGVQGNYKLRHGQGRRKTTGLGRCLLLTHHWLHWRPWSMPHSWHTNSQMVWNKGCNAVFPKIKVLKT